MEELFIKYLTTGDFPLKFRMLMSTPPDLKRKIEKCTEYINTNGICDLITAKKLVLSYIMEL